jgi:hypothetical protein
LRHHPSPQEALACVRPRLLWSSVFGAYVDDQQGDGADAFDTLMRLLAARVNATAVAPPPPPPPRPPDPRRAPARAAEAWPQPLLVDAAFAACAARGTAHAPLCDFPCAPGIPSAAASAL